MRHPFTASFLTDTVLPLLSTELFTLVRVLLFLLWVVKVPKVLREFSFLHTSEGSLGMPIVEIVS